MNKPTPTAYASLTPRQRAYSDIIVNAVEGCGIQYWASVRDYRTRSESGEEIAASVRVRDIEDPSEKRTTVTIREIASAFTKLANGEAQPHQQQKWRQAHRDVVVGNWDYDTSDADTLIQIAVYGEVVFG